MEVLRITNVGQRGLNTDLSSDQLPAEFITDGKNFIANNGRISSIKENSLLIKDTNVASLKPEFIININNGEAENYWLAVCNQAIYCLSGSVWSAVGNKPTAVVKGWAGCLMGKTAILSNRQVSPMAWIGPSPTKHISQLQFTPSKTWKELDYRCNVIRAHKNFLFALGLTEKGNELKYSYRWSHPADENALPYTWDEGDSSSLAGSAQISGNSGAIVDGLSMRDDFVIYSENAINILTFGGSFVWNRRELSPSIGLLSINCIAEVNGAHIFLGDGDIYLNNGSSIKSIIKGIFRNRFRERLSREDVDKNFVINNKDEKQVLFFIVEAGYTTPNIIYIYGWEDNSWSIKQINEEITHAAYGTIELTFKSWDSLIGSWEAWLGAWGGGGRTPLGNSVVLIGSDKRDIYLLGESDLSKTDKDPQTFIERKGFSIKGYGVITTVNRVYLHILGKGIQMQLGSQTSTDSPITWDKWREFIPDKDVKIDTRITGNLHSWRFKSLGNEPFSISGMDIEYVVSGQR